MVFTPFRAGTQVIVTQGDEVAGKHSVQYDVPPGMTAYDFAVLGNGDYTVVGVTSGTIISAREENGYGFTVRTRNDDNTFDIYAHLRRDSFLVRSGDRVATGQAIGIMGSTGNSTATHLHFERRTVQNSASSSIKVDFIDDPTSESRSGERWFSTTSSAGASAGPPAPTPPAPTGPDPRLELPIFAPQYYLATYADVRNAYGSSNFEGAKSHWTQFGIKEGRRGSLVFDPKYYLKQFQDVANAYGATNYAGAISHWLEWGLKYGRRGSVEFDPIYYMAAHPDVEAAYGVMNFSGAISHYYQWGKPGGWYGSEWITDSSAFQLGHYLANNADVKAVTNNANQEVEATRHWYFIGINEGRRGSPEFDAKFYLAKYEDVRAAYGANNYRGALDNYLLFGKAGGRVGADDTPRTLTINDVSITEGNSGFQFLVFTVSLNVVTGETVTVNYSTANGTATSGSNGTDYRGITGSLSFTPGEASKTISVEIFGDSTFENDETLIVNLSASSYASIARGQGVGSIKNDDPLIVDDGIASFLLTGTPTVGQTLTASKTADDPDGNGSFNYLWQSSADGNSWTTIGSNSATLLLGFVEVGKQVRATISHTDLEGFAESISLAPLTVSRGVVTASITGVTDDVGLLQGQVANGGLTDDPTPTISGTLSTALATGETLRIFNGTALLGSANVNNTARTWSYTPTLPATTGTSYSITARVADESGNLGTASAARIFSLVTLPFTAAENVLVLAVAPTTVTEDGIPNLVYTFTRTGPTSSPLTVYYAITGTADSSDYTGATPGAGKTISFAAGSATTTLTIDPTTDTSVEPDETVALTLAAGAGYTAGTASAVVGTILNDDAAIENQGNTKLLRRGDGMGFVEFGAATRQQINVPWGANVGSDSSEWQMVAAEMIAGTNQILWRNNTANFLHLWSLDANWTWQSSSGADPFNTPRAWELETIFQVDATRDGITGAPPTALEAQGNTKLLKRGDGMAFVEFGAATRQQINFPWGANVGSDSSEWQMVAAETIAGTNQILWRNNTANFLHLWSLDANWNWQASSGADPFNTPRAWELETIFQVDATRDGLIGAP